MWIRMISTAAGPRLPQTLVSEKIYQVDEELGRELVREKAAEEVISPSIETQSSVEIGTNNQGERAIGEEPARKISLMDELKARADGKKVEDINKQEAAKKKS